MKIHPVQTVVSCGQTDMKNLIAAFRSFCEEHNFQALTNFVTDGVALRTVLFTLLHNMFWLLSISGHHVNKEDQKLILM
jgi:hypothetical protein